MHPIWIFYLGAMTGVIVTMAVLSLFAIGSRADRPLSSSALFSDTYELDDPSVETPTSRRETPPVV